MANGGMSAYLWPVSAPGAGSGCRSADDPPLHGPQLLERLRLLEEAPASEAFPPGTRLWVRVAGSGQWPGVAWAFGLCKRRDKGQLLTSCRPGEQYK